MKIGALQSYISSLYKSGLVIYYKSPQATQDGSKKIISLGNVFVTSDVELEDTIEQYFSDLHERNYGLLLCNGGLIQIKYSLEKGKLVSHRYCYIPPPIHFFQEDNIVDYADVVNSEFLKRNKIHLRSRIRFDYDKGQEDETHPESHFTFISEDCRIPVRGGLSVQQFLRFIFRNFLESQVRPEHAELFEHSSIATGTISDSWAKEIHFSWRS